MQLKFILALLMLTILIILVFLKAALLHQIFLNFHASLITKLLELVKPVMLDILLLTEHAYKILAQPVNIKNMVNAYKILQDVILTTILLNVQNVQPILH